jgi:formylglycine-generating enzyme required for sulfatase activity
MANYPPELNDIAQFLATSSERREVIGRETAAALGDDWSPAGLVGAKKLCAVRYAPLDLIFVVVPGGRFEMGFREDDRAEVARVMDITDQFVIEFLSECEKDARPVREVAVRPHLFTQAFLSDEQIEQIEPEYPAHGVNLASAKRLSAKAGFRLPSEAEWEWVAREGGSLHFACDAPAQFHDKQLSSFDLQSGFGVEDLLGAQWLADDPHPTYEGAPATSDPWVDPNKTPSTLEQQRMGQDGVKRGPLDVAIERRVELLFCLASARSGGDYVLLRLCRDLG